MAIERLRLQKEITRQVLARWDLELARRLKNAPHERVGEVSDRVESAQGPEVKADSEMCVESGGEEGGVLLSPFQSATASTPPIVQGDTTFIVENPSEPEMASRGGCGGDSFDACLPSLLPLQYQVLHSEFDSEEGMLDDSESYHDWSELCELFETHNNQLPLDLVAAQCCCADASASAASSSYDFSGEPQSMEEDFSGTDNSFSSETIDTGLLQRGSFSQSYPSHTSWNHQCSSLSSVPNHEDDFTVSPESSPIHGLYFHYTSETPTLSLSPRLVLMPARPNHQPYTAKNRQPHDPNNLSIISSSSSSSVGSFVAAGGGCGSGGEHASS